MKIAYTKLFFLFILPLLLCYTGSAPAESPKKLKIVAVDFTNNQAFSKDQLHRVLLSRPSAFLSPSFYFPEIFQDDLKNLELFYQQNGYLEAKITGHDVAIDTARKQVRLRIDIAEGDVTYIESVSIFGNIVFSDDMLLSKMNMMPGSVFKRKNINDASLAILNLYANNGYLDAEITPSIQVNSDKHLALIDFTVNEKAQSVVGNISVSGLEKTRPKVVFRELRFRQGQIVDYSSLLKSQRRLYMTGLFKHVFIRPKTAEAGDSTRKDILIELKENLPGEFNVSVGYETIEKLRGRVEIYNTNLRGTARKIGLATKVSAVNYGFEASFTEPWTFNLPWRTDINFSMDYQEQPGFSLDRTLGKISVGRSFFERSAFTTTYKQEKVRLSDIRILEELKQDRTNIRSLKLSLIFDTRDNLFNSTEGVYSEISNELAGLFLSGTNSFVRSIYRFKYFRKWRTSTVLATAAEIGWMDAGGGLAAIPLQERFYTGGPNSVRGFDYQKIGPLDQNGTPLGGRLKLVLNIIEVRYVIYKMVGGAIFIDIGNVWDQPHHFRLDELRSAVGFGLRVNSPIGLLRLDFGFNPDRKAGEPASKIYFSMGQAF
ncbi:outer membrane protein assembly factor BamA [candidate division KSB1 bacterium]|nr:outer membrane protein assembly factor BamA [candidate division KSB1 bacterium]